MASAPPTQFDIDGPKHEPAATGRTRLSIVMPCLNEAETLTECVQAAQDFLRESDTPGEVIVADNGSTDGSQARAARQGARVIHVEQRGYGAALKAGLDAAEGQFIVMGDSDSSYDFTTLQPFLDQLTRGADVVIGNRFAGGIRAGSMPRLHRYLGNPVLSWLARMLFRVPVNDVYCGLRALTRSAFDRLQLKSPGMEFALEMIVKAQLHGLRLAEVPTTLEPDGRSRAPHLRTWSDGLRSLRFYCLCIPNGIFLFPGLVLFALCSIVGGLLLGGPVSIGSHELSIHTLVLCGFGVLIGYQVMGFGIYANVLAAALGMIPLKPWLVRVIGMLRMSFGVALGLALVVAGAAILAPVITVWRQAGFGDLDPFLAMRSVVPAGVFAALGLQTIFLSLYLSLVRFQLHEAFPDQT